LTADNSVIRNKVENDKFKITVTANKPSQQCLENICIMMDKFNTESRKEI